MLAVAGSNMGFSGFLYAQHNDLVRCSLSVRDLPHEAEDLDPMLENSLQGWSQLRVPAFQYLFAES
jgi:hypothetical protein